MSLEARGDIYSDPDVVLSHDLCSNVMFISDGRTPCRVCINHLDNTMNYELFSIGLVTVWAN